MLSIDYSKLPHCGCYWTCDTCLWLMEIIIDNLPSSSTAPPTYPISPISPSAQKHPVSLITTTQQELQPASPSTDNLQTPQLFANGLPSSSPLTNNENLMACPICMETPSSQCPCYSQTATMTDIDSIAGITPASSPQFLSDNKELLEIASMNDVSNPSISLADIAHWVGCDANIQQTGESFSRMSDKQQAISAGRMIDMSLMSQSPLEKPVKKATRRRKLSPELRIISKNKKVKFTTHVQRGLKRYILGISDHPYIDSDKAVELGKKFGITNLQVLNWFRLARTRKFTREVKDGNEIWTPKPKYFRGLI